MSFDGGSAAYRESFRLGLQIDIDVRDRQRMAQWYQVGGALAGHDAGDAGDAENVALFVAPLLDQREGVGLHLDQSLGNGAAAGGLFGADIDHMRLASSVKMGQWVMVGHVGSEACDIGLGSDDCKQTGRVMTIKVRFFASLREVVGRAEVDLPTDGLQSVTEVWVLASDGRALPGNTLAAVNMEYVGFDAAVADGDEVAFFPPVTGGDE